MTAVSPEAPTAWSSLAADPACVESLIALATVDPAELTGPDRVDAIVAYEKAMSFLAGGQMRMMDALAVPFAAGDPMRLAARLARKSCTTGDDDPDQVQQYVQEAATCLAAAEVAAALRISPVTAGIRLREAESMTHELAPTLEALEAGILDRTKARVIAENCRPLEPEDIAAVQELVLPSVGDLTTSEIRELAGHAVITVDPEGSEKRHQAAAARRELTLRPQPDAMANLSAYLPADGAVKIFQISDLLATATAGVSGDDRGIGARRVDAWIDIADQLLTNGCLDLADYLDRALPDHAQPQPRAQRSEFADDSTEPPDATTATNDNMSDRPTDPADTVTANTANDLNRPTDAAGDATDADSDVPDPATGSDPTLPDCDTLDSDDITETSFAPAPEPITASTRDTGSSDTGSATTTRRRRTMTRQGRRPHLSVVIGADTLAKKDNLPAALAGFGAIPASLGRSIALSAATVTALFADPDSGAITQTGALTYRPTQDLRDQIAALLSVCQFPACRQPVWRCDIDHREEFDHRHPEDGGRTATANTGPLCRRHHLMKHHTEWRVRVDPHRFVIDWYSPTAHRYQKKIGSPLPTAYGLSVSTGGTALAERLDCISAAADFAQNGHPDEPASVAEELLTALLLRHQLNHPGFEYEPTPQPGETDPPGAAEFHEDDDDPPPF